MTPFAALQGKQFIASQERHDRCEFEISFLSEPIYCMVVNDAIAPSVVSRDNAEPIGASAATPGVNVGSCCASGGDSIGATSTIRIIRSNSSLFPLALRPHPIMCNEPNSNPLLTDVDNNSAFVSESERVIKDGMVGRGLLIGTFDGSRCKWARFRRATTTPLSGEVQLCRSSPYILQSYHAAFCILHAPALGLTSAVRGRSVNFARRLLVTALANGRFAAGVMADGRGRGVDAARCSRAAAVKTYVLLVDATHCWCGRGEDAARRWMTSAVSAVHGFRLSPGELELYHMFMCLAPCDVEDNDSPGLARTFRLSFLCLITYSYGCMFRIWLEYSYFCYVILHAEEKVHVLAMTICSDFSDFVRAEDKG